jgi:hypothetical protein
MKTTNDWGGEGRWWCFFVSSLVIFIEDFILKIKFRKKKNKITRPNLFKLNCMWKYYNNVF